MAWRIANREWRLNNLYWIVNQYGDEVLFRPNWAQDGLLRDAGPRNVVLKTRIQGMTTLLSLLSLDTALFREKSNCVIVTHDRDQADFIFDTIRFAYESLDRHRFGHGIRRFVSVLCLNLHEIDFYNGSRVEVCRNFRAITPHFLVVNGYGGICENSPSEARDIEIGMNMVPDYGTMFVSDIAGKREGGFYDLCTHAVERGIRPHFFPWWRNPECVLDSWDLTIGDELEAYFRGLELDHGILLTNEQRGWYARQCWSFGPLVTRREYPSTIDEAFGE